MAVRIPYAVARQMADHALSEAPREACGILAGSRDQIRRTQPLRNAAEKPDAHFRFDPNEQLKALKVIDAAGLEWIGVYHSHPNAPPIPSAADIEASVDSGLLHLIVSLESSKPKLKLWQMYGSSATPIALQFDTESDSDVDEYLSRRQHAAIVIAGIASVLLLLVVSLMLLPPAPEITPVP